MTSRHFTPKAAPSKSVHFDLCANSSVHNSQFTPKFRHDVSKTEQNKELTMTVRRNQAGDTEIKFPIGGSKLMHDTQKLINRYFCSDDSEDVSFPACKEKPQEYPRFENTPVIQHYANNNNSKSSHSRQMINPPNVPNKLQNSVVNSNKSINREKSITKAEPSITNAQNVVDRKMVHLVGYVEHVIRWDQILKNVEIHVLYNVLGTFLNIINGTHAMEKYVFIKGNNGVVLECSFFEVDRPFPPITRGQFVGCFGHIIGPQKLRLYNVQLLEESERNETQRAIYLSQRITHELNNHRFS